MWVTFSLSWYLSCCHFKPELCVYHVGWRTEHPCRIADVGMAWADREWNQAVLWKHSTPTWQDLLQSAWRGLLHTNHVLRYGRSVLRAVSLKYIEEGGGQEQINSTDGKIKNSEFVRGVRQQIKNIAIFKIYIGQCPW